MRLFVCVLVSVLAVACGKDEQHREDAEAPLVSESPPSGPRTGPRTGPKKAQKKVREKTDRGEGSMLIDGIKWEASSARAKLKGEKLELRISSSHNVDGKYVRESLNLDLKPYNGVGEYSLAGMAGATSMFVVVGLDTKAVTDAAAGDDKATEAKETQKALMDTLSKAKTIRMMGAKVTIESATEDEVRGTFSHEGSQPKITEGTFRATFRKPK